MEATSRGSRGKDSGTLATSTQQSDGNRDRRFAALRRYLAREFHPDHSTGEGLEKLVRAEIFKKVWLVVEKIEKDGKA